MKPMRATQNAGRWPLWFWLLSLLAPIVFLGGMHQAENRYALDDSWRVSLADYLESAAASPLLAANSPPLADESAPWQTVELATDSVCNWKEPCAGWFRIPLPTDKSTAKPFDVSEWLLLIPNPDHVNVSLWLSGVRFDGVGHHRPVGISMPKNPISLSFPQLALREGDNHVFLQVTNSFGGIDISTLYLGPANELRSYSEHTIFVKKTLIRAILLMMGMMAVVTLLLHILRRSHTSLYGWYSLGIALWFIHTLHAQHETALFGSGWFWSRLTYVTLAAYVVGALVFVNRLTERPQPKVELCLLMLFLAGATFILADPVGVESMLQFNKMVWIPAIITGGLYMLVRLAAGARRNQDKQTLLLLAATFLGVCVGIRDYLYNDLQWVPGGMLYLRHAAGLILVAYSFVMVNRFANSERQANKSASPQSTTAKAAAPTTHPEIGQRSLLQEEHDALEYQLQQAVLNIEPSEETSQFNSNMRAARHDLQLIRDSMDRSVSSQPGELLTSMQERLSRSAKRQKITLNWQTPLITNSAYIAEHYEVALARFVQTATLDALAFPEIDKVEVTAHTSSALESDSDNTEQHAKVSATFVQASQTEFSKRAQMEAAARELGGRLAFSRTDKERHVTLSWPAPNQLGTH